MALSQISFDFDEPLLPKAKEVVKPAAKKVAEKPVAIVVEKKKSTRGRMSVKDMEATVDLIDVPVDEVLFEKSYYSIGKVAAMFKVNQSLIRFWENEFDVLKPKKNGKGDRLFRPEDVKNLKLIYSLIRERKYTIEGAKDFIKKSKKLDEKTELIENMKKLKGFLLELKANL
jgi:DNA-binding transcriptional MerR regulator